MQTIKNRVYSIYKIINLINGKLYIGCTSKTIEHRFKTHIYDSRKNKKICLYQAFMKYGIQNFKIELIEMVDTINKMYEQEKYYIKFYNTYYTFGFGYNMTLGGETGPIGMKRTPEQCQKYSEIQKQLNIKNPNRMKILGQHRANFPVSKETRQKMSLAHANGKNISAETRQKINLKNKERSLKFKVISPNNEILEIIGIVKFCKENKLDRNIFKKLLNKSIPVYKNWLLYQSEFDILENLINYRKNYKNDIEISKSIRTKTYIVN